ncbi:MAG: hypothetical protein UX58_C0002G0166 [Candidatus Wolfebacteria bacterium GW2011_GWB2_46_69]|uniref:Uncharacterized protein n=1 Tax=Candidatus Wolfebacteria bacterium GW2011_GWA2_47_9b TaxID=1619005 RepID=A0A0G1U5R5_9BACT|nr:MAG: hypothetical protein UX58_C0002G0166 [Candidatus Wolfebacteria bacterium GW2011_GWB2_46_69]KKU54237.1 MAG: hypothetical protein UX76_C0004G0041 [Candidatus Wolfebacteria bacterium GW2011_GWC1_47_103]KKU59605.1 MAG: hypothetical protein UX83_C0003G0020 [Candidatus Wolfebacteria bacterium GW2011_GWE2_47_12]KKU66249.1 MAG: hypothetical protein UX90_C0001G0308 [Candidatus Wolfebacteria bacterium GW2011_GWD2_47_17]KKU73759.1 MAG: hypothetical protein UX96_C0002G0026 [Candidatus Wolfebacteria
MLPEKERNRRKCLLHRTRNHPLDLYPMSHMNNTLGSDINIEVCVIRSNEDFRAIGKAFPATLFKVPLVTPEYRIR